MINNISYNNSKIYYKTIGNSKKTIVLLHGYLESIEIWNSFAEKLSENYKLIIPDLPGHGKSDVLNNEASVDEMAEVVKQIVVKEQVEKCAMIGHSMGGYVLLAFLENHFHFLDAITLFHSSPYSDSDDKKKNRDREIEIIKAGKKLQIYKNHFPKIFAEQNINKYKLEITKYIEIAKNMNNKGVIYALNAMKNRKNRADLLKNTQIPVQYIIGEKDNFIPMSILKKIKFPNNTTIDILKESGHLGFVEEKEKSISIIKKFYIHNS